MRGSQLNTHRNMLMNAFASWLKHMFGCTWRERKDEVEGGIEGHLVTAGQVGQPPCMDRVEEELFQPCQAWTANLASRENARWADALGADIIFNIQYI